MTKAGPWARDAVVGAVVGVVLVPIAVISAIVLGARGALVAPSEIVVFGVLVPGHGVANLLLIGQLFGSPRLPLLQATALQTFANAVIFSVAWMVIRRPGRAWWIGKLLLGGLWLAFIVAVARDVGSQSPNALIP